MRVVLAILATLVVVVIGLLVIAGPKLGELAAVLSAGPAATEVRLHEVAIGTVTEVVTAPGIVEPHLKVEVSAEVSARIVELPIREGQRVAKGSLLVKLDDRDLKAALQSASARRDADRYRLQSEAARLAGPVATLVLQKKNLERQQRLLETGDVSQQVVDDAMDRVQDLEASIDSSKGTLAVLESSLAAAEADIARAEEAVRRTTITAPIDGIITLLNAEIGELVLVGTMNNPGTVILTVADLSRMTLRAEVAEGDVARVTGDQRARIHMNAYPDRVFTGIVARVDLQRTEVAGSTPYFETEISIDLDGRQILSGLAANVDIEIEAHEGLVLPSQAVLQRPLEDIPLELRDDPAIDSSRRIVAVVYRMIDGKAICTPVRTGSSDLKNTLVREGLKVGDQVVVGPFKTLEKIKHLDPIRREGTAVDGSPVGDKAAPESDQTAVEIQS